MTEPPLLRVDNLTVRFPSPDGDVLAVRGISFAMGREKLGIVGESGSGKSMTGRAIIGLPPPAARIAADRVEFQGIDLLRAGEREMVAIRGRRIGLIMQDPRYALDPVIPVGEQIAETWRLHRSSSRAEADAKALEALEAVRIRDPARVARLYPHQVSGGMGQRVMIAMMLVAEPELLIADEPTSSLDVTVRLEVLALLDELIARRGLGLIFISHDLNLVRRFCDRVLIMYAGQIVETLPAAELERAAHPYTRGLLAALPSIREARDRLPTLTHDPAWLNRMPTA